MAYVDYEYYTSSYQGDLITDETVFNKFEVRARAKIDRMCHNRLADGLPEDETLLTKIENAMCAVIDVLYQLDIQKKAALNGEGGNVKSKSSGSESITYADDKTEITAALESVSAQDRLIYQTALAYLSGTGLLYAGLDGCNE